MRQILDAVRAEAIEHATQVRDDQAVRIANKIAESKNKGAKKKG